MSLVRDEQLLTPPKGTSMKCKTTPLIAAAALLGLAAMAAGCGGSANGSGYSSAAYGDSGTMSTPSDADGAAQVGIADSELGRILVDSKGKTLYLFEKDKGRASTCYGACASVWPPLTIKGKPTSGRAFLLGSLARPSVRTASPGHLQRAPALPLRRRREPRRHGGRSGEWVRRRVVRPRTVRQEDRPRPGRQ